jgi:glycine/D-amino acid oxidase-like deaminating enzyme
MARVVILGAGISGHTAALHLKRRLKLGLSVCPVDNQVIVAGQIVNDISVTKWCRARTRLDPDSLFLAHRSMAAPGSWRRRTNSCPWATAS